MKRLAVFIVASSTALGLPLAGQASDDFYGMIDSRPADKVGTWVIGGRSATVTQETRLDDDDGPLVVGACVSVDYDEGLVEEIETEPASKCRNR